VTPAAHADLDLSKWPTLTPATKQSKNSTAKIVTAVHSSSTKLDHAKNAHAAAVVVATAVVAAVAQAAVATAVAAAVVVAQAAATAAAAAVAAAAAAAADAAAGKQTGLIQHKARWKSSGLFHALHLFVRNAIKPYRSRQYPQDRVDQSRCLAA